MIAETSGGGGGAQGGRATRHNNNDSVKVHDVGWKAYYDEWLPRMSKRIWKVGKTPEWFAKLAVDAEHGRLAVVVCGPAAMVSIASEATRAHGVAFHAETFEL